MSARCFAILSTHILAAFLVAFGSAAETTLVFGPTDYTRIAGKPQTFTETFERCGTSACQIVVTNGNSDGTQRISSASISVNGVKIVHARDLNQKVDGIVRSVDLAEENELTVTLAANPGGFLRVAVECEASGVTLGAFAPGVDLLDATTLSSALTIGNTGTVDAEDVELTEIMLDGGNLISPVPLPVGLGTIAANGAAVLESSYSGDFVPTDSYPLALKGTYVADDATFCFELDSILTIPPASPGSAPLFTLAVPPHFADGPFPPREPEGELEANNPGWTVPTGPFVPGGPPSDVTEILAPPALAVAGTQAVEGAGADAAPPVVFKAIRSLGFTAGISPTAEPSGAGGGGMIFVSSNWMAAYSTDGGNTFTSLDPTTVFPADAIGFCCDQVVQYVGSINRFVWLLQGSNFRGYRLAVASPGQITVDPVRAWTYWNLPTNLFGTCTGFDYPDMSIGNNFVYLSWDASGPGCTNGLQVARTSFAGLQAGGTITLEFTDQANAPMAWGSHITHDTGDEVFWAGHPSTSELTVFSLREDSNTYFWRDVGISRYPNNTPITSLTPDNQNWVNFLHNPNPPNLGGFPKDGVIGATRRGNEVWFAWSAGTDGNFPQAHIQMVALDRNDDFATIQQVQVWNPNYAFAYPALSRNRCTGEVGLSFEFGGGGNYENHVVGFWGDFVAYVTTASDVGSTRFGDYVTIRQAVPTLEDPGNLFTAFGYGRNSVPGSGNVSDVRYVLFGRPPESCLY